MYFLKMEFDRCPDSTNVKLTRNHWGRNHEEATDWEWWVKKASMGRRPTQPLELATIKIVRFSHRMLDFDGMVGSFKPVVDALVKNGIIIDDRWSVVGPWVVDQVFRPKKEGQRLDVIVKQVTLEP